MYKISDDQRKLLVALLENGRKTQKEIGAKLGFTPKKMSETISTLQTNNVISGFTVSINYAELGFSVEGYFIFKLKRKGSTELREIRDFFTGHSSIIEAYELFGKEYDFMIKIMCKSNTELRSICETIDSMDNVENESSYTFTVAKVDKHNPGVPL